MKRRALTPANFIAFFSLCTIVLCATVGVVAFGAKGKVAERKIRYSFKKIDGKVVEIVFENAPANVHGLKRKPNAREKELDQGNWLVVNVGVFSVPDIRCIDLVLAIAQAHPKVHFGVRPFWDYAEVTAWFPEYKDADSPIWIVLNDGKVSNWTTGPLNQNEIKALLQKGLPK